MDKDEMGHQMYSSLMNQTYFNIKEDKVFAVTSANLHSSRLSLKFWDWNFWEHKNTMFDI